MHRADLEVARVEAQFLRLGIEAHDRQFGRALETVRGEIRAEVERDVPDQETVGFRVGMRVAAAAAVPAKTSNRERTMAVRIGTLLGRWAA